MNLWRFGTISWHEVFWGITGVYDLVVLGDYLCSALWLAVIFFFFLCLVP